MSFIFRLVCCLFALTFAEIAHAETESAGREASRHFQRALDLHNEGDFRGALVEFKKAYTLLPRAVVLYNIGQMEFQVKQYAEALRTLEQFLAETGPKAAHRAEVEETVAVLRGRVGRIEIAGARGECDLSVDDQPAGTTPLAKPLVVSIGLRRVAMTCAGRPPASRDVEVAAGELVRVALEAPKPPPAPPMPPPVVAPSAAIALSDARVDEKTGRGGRVAAWTITGVLAAGTVGLYTTAAIAARDVAKLRRTYPITAADLDEKRQGMSRYAFAGDVLAAATLAGAAFATYLSLTAPPERGVRLSAAVGPSFGGVNLHATY